LVVVVRFFGGIKLGVGGLIIAYKTSAQLTLESCEIIEKTIDINYLVCLDYKNINKVMRIIKENKINIINQKMGLICEIEISVRKKQANRVFEILNSLFEIEIKPIT
jgi:putative IMPACT (imprinted ancient) family translation regulator